MKIAVAGKGGSGKTTIAGTLARALADTGHDVLAIDADLNPNLGPTLGMPKEHFDAGTPLSQDILTHAIEGDRQVVVLARPLEEIVSDFALQAPGGIRLLTMGRPEEAGFG